MNQTECITAPCENVSPSFYEVGNKPFSIGAYIFTEMGKIKRKGTQGHFSEYHRIWNGAHPNDLIVAGDGNVIHHIDENPNNNSPDNLLKMTDVEHKKYHTNNGKHPNQGKTYSKELCDKLSKAHLGHTHSEESKNKMKGRVPWNKGLNYHTGKPSGMKGKTHSKETIEKMSGKIPWNKGKKGVQKAWNKGLKKDDYGKK
jgi:hypothetical protein